MQTQTNNRRQTRQELKQVVFEKWHARKVCLKERSKANIKKGNGKLTTTERTKKQNVFQKGVDGQNVKKRDEF